MGGYDERYGDPALERRSGGEPGGGPDRVQKLNRAVLWLVTVVVLLVLTFPTWSSWIWS